MKKSELEEAYHDLQNRYNKLHSDTRIEIQNLKQEIEDKSYEAWKMMNGKFMKRYIEELIMRNELQFSFETGYSGHFDMQIYMGDKFLTSVNGDICMNRNTLEL